MKQHKYDAIIILSGGIRSETTVPPWVQERLNAAIELKNQARYIITTSAATPHLALPLDSNKQPLYDARVMNNILIKSGINPNKILTESFSLDTVGNAIFTKLLITNPLKLKNLLIITSKFHMPRSKVLFQKIFNLEEDNNQTTQSKYYLEFLSTDNTNMPEDQLKARTNKENRRIKQFQEETKNLSTIKQFQEWLLTVHGAYKSKQKVSSETVDVRKTY